MPIFSFKCEDHGVFKKLMPRRKPSIECPVCGKESFCVLKPSSMQIIERLDNGAMARAVERLHNIEEIMDERNEKSKKRAKEQRGEVEED